MKNVCFILAGLFISIMSAAQCSVNIQPVYDCAQTCSGFANATNPVGASPFSYSWSNGDSGTQADSLCHDSTYVLTLTDNNGCVATDTLVMLSGFTFTSSTVTNTSCFSCCDGSDTVYATASSNCGPLMYQWFPYDQFPTLSNYRTNLCAGTYTVLITDGCGCSGAWTCYVNYNTSTSIPMTEETTWSVSQNGNNVILHATENLDRIELFDLQGKSLFIREDARGDIEILLDNFAEGLFILKITEDGENKAQLIRKQ
jgi:hypothetical protein